MRSLQCAHEKTCPGAIGDIFWGVGDELDPSLRYNF
jgi:hypothetical protein